MSIQDKARASYPAVLLVKVEESEIGLTVWDDEGRFIVVSPEQFASRKPEAEAVIAEVEKFMATVHGMNEMNVIRGLRKVMAGEPSTFSHEVKLSVYGKPCGHEVPSHYPEGYGECDACKERRIEERWAL